MDSPFDFSDNDAGADIAMRLCHMPAFVAAWVGRFYDPAEVQLLALCDANGARETELCNRLVAAEVASTDAAAQALIHRSVVRGVLSDTSDNRLQPAEFHVRFDYWALFEGWQDIPADVRWQLNQWELEAYIEKHRQTAIDLKAGVTRDVHKVIPEYVLIHEAQALVERVSHVYLWPCNCRSMLAGCKQSRLTCLRFDNPRGIGWEISKARAQTILVEASRKGLMHSAELGLTSEGQPSGAICNCCSDCCFPHRLADRERLACFWPLSRYVARLDPVVCNGCGRCERRCPFGAIRLKKSADPDRPPAALVSTELCRGCGVCAAGCLQAAIEMFQLRESVFEEWYQPPTSPPF